MSINLDGWIGRELVEDDFVSLDRARLLATTLGREPTEEEIAEEIKEMESKFTSLKNDHIVR